MTVVDAIGFAGRREGKQNRQILPAGFTSGEKPVASSACNSSHLNLGGIIVKIQFWIIKEFFELVFNIQRISCGFCQWRGRQLIVLPLPAKRKDIVNDFLGSSALCEKLAVA